MAAGKFLGQCSAPGKAKHVDLVVAKFVDEAGDQAGDASHRGWIDRCRAAADAGSIERDGFSVAQILTERLEEIAADQTDEIEASYAEMLDAYEEFEDEHLMRRRLIYIAGIIYLANIADAVRQFPESGDGYFAAATITERPGFFASVEPDAVVFGVNVPF